MQDGILWAARVAMTGLILYTMWKVYRLARMTAVVRSSRVRPWTSSDTVLAVTSIGLATLILLGMGVVAVLLWV